MLWEVSPARGAHLGLQGSFEASDKCVRFKRLPKEASCATRKGLFLKAKVAACGYHDYRHRASGYRKVLLQFDAAHARHLDIRDDARKAMDCSASEERLGGCEAVSIVVYDGDQWSRWHAAPFP